MSCGRRDRQIQLRSCKFYLSSFWALGQNMCCFYLSDVSTMSHLKAQRLLCFPHCCLVPTPSPRGFPGDNSTHDWLGSAQIGASVAVRSPSGKGCLYLIKSFLVKITHPEVFFELQISIFKLQIRKLKYKCWF